jgi:hypothetical protein
VRVQRGCSERQPPSSCGTSTPHRSRRSTLDPQIWECPNARSTPKRVSRDTKWKARYRDPKGRARSKTFDRKHDAEKFLARVDTDIQRDDWVDPQRRRAGFDEWADAWLATTARLTASTRRGYEKTLRLYVRPAFGGRRIASIDWLEVELFVSALVERGLSPKTCREAVSILSLIMKTALRAKVIRETRQAATASPFADVERPCSPWSRSINSSTPPTRATRVRSGCSSSPGSDRPNSADFACATSTGRAARLQSTRPRCG